VARVECIEERDRIQLGDGKVNAEKDEVIAHRQPTNECYDRDDASQCTIIERVNKECVDKVISCRKTGPAPLKEEAHCTRDEYVNCCRGGQSDSEYPTGRVDENPVALQCSHLVASGDASAQTNKSNDSNGSRHQPVVLAQLEYSMGEEHVNDKGHRGRHRQCNRRFNVDVVRRCRVTIIKHEILPQGDGDESRVYNVKEPHKEDKGFIPERVFGIDPEVQVHLYAHHPRKYHGDEPPDENRPERVPDVCDCVRHDFGPVNRGREGLASAGDV